MVSVLGTDPQFAMLAVHPTFSMKSFKPELEVSGLFAIWRLFYQGGDNTPSTETQPPTNI